MKCAGAIVGLAFALATHAEAAEIKVISTGGARAVMTSVVPEFERKSGHKVGIDFGTPGNMRDRLLADEAADESHDNHDARGGGQKVLHRKSGHLSEIAHGGLARVPLPVRVGNEADGGIERGVRRDVGELLRVQR